LSIVKMRLWLPGPFVLADRFQSDPQRVALAYTTESR
jgi:hypothetical protein